MLLDSGLATDPRTHPPRRISLWAPVARKSFLSPHKRGLAFILASLELSRAKRGQHTTYTKHTSVAALEGQACGWDSEKGNSWVKGRALTDWLSRSPQALCAGHLLHPQGWQPGLL